MFFKQQECTGRWIRVESKAVCKTAETQTEMTYFSKMAAVQEGIVYVMEVSTSWSQHLKCTVLRRLIRYPATTMRCPSPTSTASGKKGASKVSLSTACNSSFIHF